jgi:hypothetical protein
MHVFIGLGLVNQVRPLVCDRLRRKCGHHDAEDAYAQERRLRPTL